MGVGNGKAARGTLPWSPDSSPRPGSKAYGRPASAPEAIAPRPAPTTGMDTPFLPSLCAGGRFSCGRLLAHEAVGSEDRNSVLWLAGFYHLKAALSSGRPDPSWPSSEHPEETFLANPKSWGPCSCPYMNAMRVPQLPAWCPLAWRSSVFLTRPPLYPLPASECPLFSDHFPQE